MAGPGGVNSAAAAAAAAAKRAEEARKAAERAREQQRKAEEARKAAQAQKASKKAVEKLQKNEQKLEQKVVKSSRAAENAIRDANAKAKKAGKEVAFDKKDIAASEVKASEVKDALEGAAKGEKEALAKQLGVGVKDAATTTEIETQLKGQRLFDDLRTDAKAATTLQDLDIRNGDELRGLGERLAKEAGGGARGLEPVDLSGARDKDSLSKVIQAAGASLTGEDAQKIGSKVFADAVAQGISPAAAAKTLGANATTTNNAQGGGKDPVVDHAVKGLPPEKAKKVREAVARTRAADGASPQARADQIEQQSRQFKGDPAAARAYAQAISPEVTQIGHQISTPDNKDAGPVLQKLAQASDNLGAGGTVSLGNSLAKGVPDTTDLQKFDDGLRDVSKSPGGRNLLFATAKGFEDTGKKNARGDLENELNDAQTYIPPGIGAQPVDPKAPDAAEAAELNVMQAKYAQTGGDRDQNYINALHTQLDALKDNPAARQQFAQSQSDELPRLAIKNASGGPIQATNIRTVLDAAQAAGGPTLQNTADAYARTIGHSKDPLTDATKDVTPEGAKALTRAFLKTGNVDLAKKFAEAGTGNVTSATKAAKKANDNVDRLQNKLNQELQHVGPGLTPQQRNEFEKKFWDRHRGAIDDQKKANANLEHVLKTEQADQRELARTNPVAAQKYADGLKELSRDPNHAQFVRSEVDKLKGPNGAFPPELQSAEKTLVTARVGASQQIANKQLAEGDTEGAYKTLKDTQEFLSNTKFASSEVSEFVKKGLPELKSFIGVVGEAVRTKDPSVIGRFLQNDERAGALQKSFGDSALGKSLGQLTKAVGVGVYLFQASKEPGEADRLKAIVSAGNSGAELVADGFKAYAESTRIASQQLLRSSQDLAGDVSKLLKNVTPVLSLGLDVWSDVSSVKGAINNPTVGSVGQAIGDTLTAVGGAAALVPGGEAVGAALAVIGKGVSIVTGFIQSSIDRGERRDEEASILKDIYTSDARNPNSPLHNLTPDQLNTAADRIAHNDENLAGVAQNAGLKPDDVVELAAKVDVSQPFFRIFAESGRLGGAKGQDFVDWTVKTSHRKDFGETLLSPRYENANSAKTIAWNQAADEADRKHLTGEARSRYISSHYQQKYDDIVRRDLENTGLLPP